MRHVRRKRIASCEFPDLVPAGEPNSYSCEQGRSRRRLTQTVECLQLVQAQIRVSRA